MQSAPQGWGDDSAVKTALLEDPSSVSCTHCRQLTASFNSSSRGLRWVIEQEVETIRSHPKDQQWKLPEDREVAGDSHMSGYSSTWEQRQTQGRRMELSGRALCLQHMRPYPHSPAPETKQEDKNQSLTQSDDVLYPDPTAMAELYRLLKCNKQEQTQIKSAASSSQGKQTQYNEWSRCSNRHYRNPQCPLYPILLTASVYLSKHSR